MVNKQTTFGTNLKRGLEGFLVSVMTTFVLGVLIWLVRWIIKVQEMPSVGILMGMIVIFLYFELWGYFAYIFWKWKA